jgi:hypothetical protein
MQGCATSPGNFYQSVNVTDLEKILKEITSTSGSVRLLL